MPEYHRLAEELRRLGVGVAENEPMSRHTSFCIGGRAALYLTPQTAEQLEAVYGLLRDAGCRIFLLGNGTNTLFADEGFDGAVVGTAGLREISLLGTNGVRALCGASLGDVCRFALEAGLSGLEFAYGIPGSVGGAVTMNAGAYGGQMSDVVLRVRLFTSAGAEADFSAADLCFGYRASRIQREGGVVLWADLGLKNGDPAAIREQMDSLLARRREKQPLDKPSAGSMFKRPCGNYASALIDRCGLRGYRVGGAAVSEKHCGFVVNLGGATAADVIKVAEDVEQIVFEKTGIRLEREILVVG